MKILPENIRKPIISKKLLMFCDNRRKSLQSLKVKYLDYTYYLIMIALI